MLRCMGQNPSDSQVSDMINEADVDGSGVIKFEEFEKCALRLFGRDQEEEEDMVLRLFKR